MDQKAFLSLLAAAVQHGASDIHLHPGMSPGFRLRGDLVNVKGEPLTEADFQVFVQVLFHGKKLRRIFLRFRITTARLK